MLKYLSPTSISLFEKDREQFYLNYMADTRAERDPQTQPMAVGSSVDAYIKSYLHEKLYGKGSDPAFEFTAIFETQVEAHNRDWALEHGKYLFDFYMSSGALADFAVELNMATSDPKFEFTIESRVAHDLVQDGVPLLGKPDIYYWVNDLLIIRDWKVNGYCGSRPVTPKKGYINLRPGNKTHKKAILANYGLTTINIAHTLDEVDANWARQIAIYGWVLGTPVGSDFIASIEQFACSGPMNPVKIALHRTKLCEIYQKTLHNRIGEIWSMIQSGHIFDDLSIEENDNKIDRLNKIANDPNEAMFHELTKKPSWY